MASIDPRGIRRVITRVEDPTVEDGRCFVTFECGHRSEFAAHFHYDVGNTMHCFACGDESAKEFFGAGKNEW